jgi:hypothetical protein
MALRRHLLRSLDVVPANSAVQIGDTMKSQTPNGKLARLALTCVLALALCGEALAESPRGGGGGHAPVSSAGHGGYGGYHGGYGGYRGGYGGYYGGYRGGYWGYRGGYGWGWAGLGLGLYFATLPLYYSTLWWGGVPYYYANDTYYRWDGTVGRYETVVPPPELQNQVAGSSAASELIAYPKNAQTAEQQAKDKYECHRWAADKTGFDPTQGANANVTPNGRADYMRAQAACLDGRGYSVR